MLILYLFTTDRQAMWGGHEDVIVIYIFQADWHVVGAVGRRGGFIGRTRPPSPKCPFTHVRLHTCTAPLGSIDAPYVVRRSRGVHRQGGRAHHGGGRGRGAHDSGPRRPVVQPVDAAAGGLQGEPGSHACRGGRRGGCSKSTACSPVKAVSRSAFTRARYAGRVEFLTGPRPITSSFSHELNRFWVPLVHPALPVDTASETREMDRRVGSFGVAAGVASERSSHRGEGPADRQIPAPNAPRRHRQILFLTIFFLHFFPSAQERCAATGYLMTKPFEKQNPMPGQFSGRA